MERVNAIWSCKVGAFTGLLPDGSDLPMRQAVKAAYKEWTGEDADYVFSGWGGTLTEAEQAVVDGTEPPYAHYLIDASADEYRAALRAGEADPDGRLGQAADELGRTMADALRRYRNRTGTER